MLPSCKTIQDLKDLRDHVNETLCQYDQLELDAFPLTQRILVRNNVPCGVFFCLHGPRAVKFTAIWETRTNTILFYTSTGERFHKTQLTRAPRLEAALS